MASPAPARSLGELPADALLRGEDVARYLGVSARTVARQPIPYIAIARRTRRYRAIDVLRWIDAQRRNGGAA